MCELKFLFLNRARWTSLTLEIISKINILGGNNKTVVWSTACPISDVFGKGGPIFGSAYASSNIDSPLPNKSDIGQWRTK